MQFMRLSHIALAPRFLLWDNSVQYLVSFLLTANIFCHFSSVNKLQPCWESVFSIYIYILDNVDLDIWFMKKNYTHIVGNQLLSLVHSCMVFQLLSLLDIRVGQH